MNTEFRILGPLEVVIDGRHVDPGPPRQRALLALLLIHANQVVATDRILDLIWGDDAAGKENALWVYVSRLRSLLEPDRTARGESSYLVTGENGYVLRIDRESIDAVAFEGEAQEGRTLMQTDPGRAGEVLARALERWRGDALQEFMYEEFARGEISRLEELRLAALEDRIDSDLLVGRARELIGELESVRQAHPLRERPVSQLTLALYRSGRHAEALRAVESFRRYLATELGIEPSARLRLLEEQVLLQDPRLDGSVRHASGRTAVTVSQVSNPYKGLRPFTEDDAALFFGRKRLSGEVIHRVTQGARLLTLVGPSGSGKSSVVRAGVIPAVRKSNDKWIVARMVPGAHPFAELEAALLRSSLDAPDTLGEQLGADDTGILRAALRMLPDSETRLLLVIDQFEELFALTDDAAVRDRFLDQLITAVDDPHGRIVAVLTLRSDFYGEPLAHPRFGARLGDGVINVVPLLPNELEAAAEEPARQRGVAVEPTLLVRLITEVVGEPGALPLFQFALAELFDRRTSDTLTLDIYDDMGGVEASITRRAEAVLEGLKPDQQEATRQLFLRLVRFADGGQLGHRRVLAHEIMGLGVDLVSIQIVVDAFATNRLLTLDRDRSTGSPTIEVSHEALLTEWDRLRRWIEEAEQDIRRHRSLQMALHEWVEADRALDYLLSGSRLDVYEAWADESTMRLSGEEREFLEASLQARDELESADAQRRATEQRLMITARRRLWALVAVVAGVLVIAVLWLMQPEPARVAVLMPGLPEEQAGLLVTGTERAERELGVRFEELTGRLTDLEAKYRELAEGDTDLIFLDNGNTGWEWVEDVIADYPDTDFAVINGVLAPAGAHAVYFADEEAGFLAGVTAGLTTETDVVGFVGNYQSDTSERWRAGFEHGARSVAPDAQVVAIYTGLDGVRDPEAGKAAANELFQRGADVVLAFAGDATVGVMEAALDAFRDTRVHRWVIGSETDWSLGLSPDLQPHILTSVVRQWDVAVFEVVDSHVDGELGPGIRVLGIEDGAISLTRSEHLAADALAAIEQLGSDVITGQITLPRAPVGELLPPAGTVVTDTFRVTWDGEHCTSDLGATDMERGDTVRVEFVNRSPEYWYFFVFSNPGGVPASTLVQPNAQNAVYLTLSPATFQFHCGSPIRDRPASEVFPHTQTGGVLTVGF